MHDPDERPRMTGVIVFLIECRVPPARVCSPHTASPLHPSLPLLPLNHHSPADPTNTAKSQHPIAAPRSTPRRPKARKTEPSPPRCLPRTLHPPHSPSPGGAGHPAISTAQRSRLPSCMTWPRIPPRDGCDRARGEVLGDCARLSDRLTQLAPVRACVRACMHACMHAHTSMRAFRAANLGHVSVGSDTPERMLGGGGCRGDTPPWSLNRAS